MVKLIFLGGVAEIGRNLFLLEHEESIVVVDCGIGFPEEDQLGIDLILPNVQYLRERANQIEAIFITHGHEDHIGALPYVLPDLKAPVYSTRLTKGLIAGKLEESGFLNQADLRAFDPDDDAAIEAGPFSVTPFRVTHSIPDCVGFGIDTPAGLIVHTGDFKLDPTPIDDRATDLDRIRSFGERGVRLLISDTTHIETREHTSSERVVGETFDKVFDAANGRIIIATFSSQIARIQQVIDTAAKHDRRVVVLGRSMLRNVEIAGELGYLSDGNRVIIDSKDAVHIADNKIVYLVTGSQGEPMAALSRIANGDHRDVATKEGDTVVISATPIPGNETSVYRVINQLFKQGAEVIYSARALIHVSGHGSWEEISKIVELTQPQHTLPFHGEHRHMALFADLALEHGITRDRVTMAEVGDVIEITPEKVEIAGRVEASPVFVDGAAELEIGEVVIRDRQELAGDGIVMVVVSVDRETGEVVAGPELVTRGFVHAGESKELLGTAKDRVRQVLDEHMGQEHSGDWSYLSRQIRDATSKFLSDSTGRRPMVLPMVMEV